MRREDELKQQRSAQTRQATHKIPERTREDNEKIRTTEHKRTEQKKSREKQYTHTRQENRT